MNLVSLLIATSVVKYAGNHGLRAGVALGALAIIVASVVISKRRASGIASSDADRAGGPGAAAPADEVEQAKTDPAAQAESAESQAESVDGSDEPANASLVSPDGNEPTTTATA